MENSPICMCQLLESLAKELQQEAPRLQTQTHDGNCLTVSGPGENSVQLKHDTWYRDCALIKFEGPLFEPFLRLNRTYMVEDENDIDSDEWFDDTHTFVFEDETIDGVEPVQDGYFLTYHLNCEADLAMVRDRFLTIVRVMLARFILV